MIIDKPLSAVMSGSVRMNTITPNCFSKLMARNRSLSHRGLTAIHPNATISGTDQGKMENTNCSASIFNREYPAIGSARLPIPSIRRAVSRLFARNATSR